VAPSPRRLTMISHPARSASLRTNRTASSLAPMSPSDAGGWSLVASMRWVIPAAALLVVATLLRFGIDGNGMAWALVQVVLVALTAHDIATRRLPNALTVPVGLLALALRAVFERSELGQVALAGVIAFLVFYVVALLVRGGFGMGDVKLAAMLGFLLGSAVIGGLTIGIIAGGVASVVLLLLSRANLRSKIAYGPYLAFGGAIAILFLHPPALV
jgi:leader peptidase (prepilin peptidase) / N-methyltransferase